MTTAPAPAQAPVIAGQRFEQIRLITNRQTGTGPVGTLIAQGDSLVFQQQNGGVIPLPKIRRLTRSAGRFDVEYGGDGLPIAQASFVDMSRGALHVRAAANVLEPKLRAALTIVPWSAEDQQVVVAAEHKVGRKRMLIGAIVFAVGLIVTIATYNNASDEGGTYVVWWGPMLFGLLIFAQGLFEALKRR